MTSRFNSRVSSCCSGQLPLRSSAGSSAPPQREGRRIHTPAAQLCLPCFGQADGDDAGLNGPAQPHAATGHNDVGEGRANGERRMRTLVTSRRVLSKRLGARSCKRPR